MKYLNLLENDSTELVFEDIIAYLNNLYIQAISIFTISENLSFYEEKVNSLEQQLENILQ